MVIKCFTYRWFRKWLFSLFFLKSVASHFTFFKISSHIAIFKSFAQQSRLLWFLQIFFISLQLRPKSCIWFCYRSGSFHSLENRRDMVEARYPAFVGVMKMNFELKILRSFTLVLIWLQSNKYLFWWADFILCLLGTDRWVWLQNRFMGKAETELLVCWKW